jgi:tight adherence protein B
MTVACMLILAPNAGASGLRVSVGNAGLFPGRALLVTAPANGSVTPQTVHVTESGAAVKGLAVTNLSNAAAGDFGVILLIDTSQSMQGGSIRQAMAAARTLAAERRGRQELGVIEFSRAVTAVVPLTSNATSIAAALTQTPRLAVGTHIYDATLQAIQALHRSGVAAASVIVLSDGADLMSHATEQDVAAAAAVNNVRIYTVGFEDRSFTPRTLASLAAATGGSYIGSSGARLGEVFTQIESQLVSRYLVRYRSRAGFGRRVDVNVQVDGVAGRWTGSYDSPAASPAVRVRTTPATSQPVQRSFWQSTLALALVVGLSASAIVLGFLIRYAPRARHEDLRVRIGRFTAFPEADSKAEAERTSILVARIERALSRRAWGVAFQREVDVARIERTAAEVIVLMLAITVPLGVGLPLATNSAVLAPLLCLLGPVVMVSVVRRLAGRQRALFQDQLAPHLEEIGAAMRAGYSAVASIGSMAQDAVEPSRREFTRALADEQLGVPIEAALRPIAERMRCSDLNQLGLVASLNQRTGGNMAEILDLIAAAVRERAELRRELAALTAQARLSRWVVSALPPGMLLLLVAIRPAYVQPLFHTSGGALVLLLAAGMLAAGSLAMHYVIGSED